MRENVYYNTQHQRPPLDFGYDFELITQIRNCASPPVADSTYIYVPLLSGTIQVLRLDGLQHENVIDLRRVPSVISIKNRKHDFRNLYLLSHQNMLIVQLDDSVHIYDPATDKWSFLLEEKDVFVLSSSFILENNLFLSVTCLDKQLGKIYSFDMHSRKILWEYTCEPTSHVLYENGRIILISSPYVVCCSMEDGTLLWKTEIASYGDYYDELWEQHQRGIISSNRVLVNNQVIFGIHKGKVISLHVEDGTINWMLSLDEDDYSYPSVVYQGGDSNAYILSDNLYEIDFVRGRIKQVYPIEEMLDQHKLCSGHIGISTSALFIGTTRRTPSLVALNKSTFEITKIHTMEDHCTEHGFPALIGKYLTTMDFSGNLSVFLDVN